MGCESTLPSAFMQPPLYSRFERLSVGLFPGSNVEKLIRWVEIDWINPVVRLRKRTQNGMVV